MNDLTEPQHTSFIKDINTVIKKFIDQDIFMTSILKQILHNIITNQPIDMTQLFETANNQQTVGQRGGNPIIGFTLMNFN
jgi:hypothetical protein